MDGKQEKGLVCRVRYTDGAVGVKGAERTKDGRAHAFLSRDRSQRGGCRPRVITSADWGMIAEHRQAQPLGPIQGTSSRLPCGDHSTDLPYRRGTGDTRTFCLHHMSITSPGVGENRPLPDYRVGPRPVPPRQSGLGQAGDRKALLWVLQTLKAAPDKRF